MSRWIEVEPLISDLDKGLWGKDWDKVLTEAIINGAPSIDIVRCGECEWEWTQKCPPHRMGLIHDASDYCSYGIRKTDGVDKHDEAVEALGHLIKRMKGADHE